MFECFLMPLVEYPSSLQIYRQFTFCNPCPVQSPQSSIFVHLSSSLLLGAANREASRPLRFARQSGPSFSTSSAFLWREFLIPLIPKILQRRTSLQTTSLRSWRIPWILKSERSSNPEARPADGSAAGRKKGKPDFTFFLFAVLPEFQALHCSFNPCNP